MKLWIKLVEGICVFSGRYTGYFFTAITIGRSLYFAAILGILGKSDDPVNPIGTVSMAKFFEFISRKVFRQFGSRLHKNCPFHFAKFRRALGYARVELCICARSNFSHCSLQLGCLTFNSRFEIFMASMGSLTASPVPVRAPYRP